MQTPHTGASTPKLDGKAPVPGEAVFNRKDLSGKTLIVCVHGMGDQVRNDFAQTIGRLFARNLIRDPSSSSQATELPIGCWDGGGRNAVDDHAVAYAALNQEAPGLGNYAFAEVHWADLPRKLENTYQLEESKRWAGTVAKRFGQRYRDELEGKHDLTGARLAVTVLEELIEAVGVFQRLLSLADKAGIFRFDLAHLLTAYLGDVQQVTEFQHLRDDAIQKRFHRRMEFLAKTDYKEIHVIAHSEGTVVAFHGLLEAIRKQDCGWIQKVRSFTTLGSPIDKHLILWPEMWEEFNDQPRGTWTPREEDRIRWHNYYDYADPVGYELDTARVQLDRWGLLSKHFDAKIEEHDHGFRRYPLPGKAHVDYFGDDDLFAHVIRESIGNHGDKNQPVLPCWRYAGKGHACAARPASDTTPCSRKGPSQADRLAKNAAEGIRNRPLHATFCRVMPFALVVLLCALAVFVLHKSLGLDPGTLAADLKMELCAKCAAKKSTWGILGGACLLTGTLVLARMVRLVRSLASLFWGFTAFALGAWAFVHAPGLVCLDRGFHWFGASKPASLALYCFVVVLIAWGLDARWLSRRTRPVWGLRALVLGAGVVALWLVAPGLLDSTVPDPGERPPASALQLLTGGLAFVYLWYLAILLFDLAFCWAYYINCDKSLVTRMGEKVRGAGAGAARKKGEPSPKQAVGQGPAAPA